jgi:hypothetical protein
MWIREYVELERRCIELFKEGKVEVLSSPGTAPIIIVWKSDGLIRVYIY